LIVINKSVFTLEMKVKLLPEATLQEGIPFRWDFQWNFA